ncbi:hypothetical protein CCP2SC5_20095 [Azospirillaceae bacterium]
MKLLSCLEKYLCDYFMFIIPDILPVSNVLLLFPSNPTIGFIAIELFRLPLEPVRKEYQCFHRTGS